MFIVGRFLKSLAELAQTTGCTPVLCHHLKKGVADPYEPAELENIAWAGFQEFARQWILLNRRVRYDPDRGGHHELWMSVGGSAGHSGIWGLNIDEGTRQDPNGRHWDVELWLPAMHIVNGLKPQSRPPRRRSNGRWKRRWIDNDRLS